MKTKEWETLCNMHTKTIALGFNLRQMMKSLSSKKEIDSLQNAAQAIDISMDHMEKILNGK